MNFEQHAEFEKCNEYILKQKIAGNAAILYNFFYAVSSKKPSKDSVLTSLNLITKFLKKVESSPTVSYFIKCLYPTITISSKEFETICLSFDRSSNNEISDQFKEAYQNLSKMIDSIKGFCSFNSAVENSTENFNHDNILVVTFELNNQVTVDNAFKGLKNVHEILEQTSKMLMLPSEFKVIHVEDGSLKMYIATGTIILSLLGPIIKTTTSSYSDIMKIIHQSKIYDIKEKIIEEELRHLKKENVLKEEKLEVDDAKIEKLVELQKKRSESQIKSVKEAYKRDIEYEKQKILIKYANCFEQNSEILLGQIVSKIEKHYQKNGYLEVLKVENKVDEEKSFQKIAYIKTHKSLMESKIKLIEMSIDDTKTNISQMDTEVVEPKDLAKS